MTAAIVVALRRRGEPLPPRNPIRAPSSTPALVQLKQNLIPEHSLNCSLLRELR
jgi:hypothetical protein